MSAKDDGLQLWDEAYKILNARLQTDDATYHRVAQQKAVEISDFLAQYGEELDKTDPDVVTNLGKAVDALASGVQDTLPAVQKSPTGAALDQFGHDISHPGDIIADELDPFKRWIKKYRGWLIAGGALVGIFTVGYTVRAFK